MNDFTLKKCPCCGSVNVGPFIEDTGAYPGSGLHGVICRDCTLTVTGKVTPGAAAAIWNTRPERRKRAVIDATKGTGS